LFGTRCAQIVDPRPKKGHSTKIKSQQRERKQLKVK